MKLSVRLTMQGLIRALQGRGHDLAEALEGRRGRSALAGRQPRPPKRRGGKNGVGRR